GILNFRRISLCELCGPLCLCGEVCSREVNHRDTEDHRVCTEKNNFYWILAITLAILFSPACYRSESVNTSTSATRAVTDEAGRRVVLPQKIDRIISLAPNLTEIVYAVGAGDRLVGRTRYCDYPAEAKQVAEVGDTMTPSVERIIALKPQIVLVSTASQLEAFTNQLSAQQIA